MATTRVQAPHEHSLDLDSALEAVASNMIFTTHTAVAAGHDLDRVLLTDDLVRCDNVFFAATGITDGELLAGVRYRAGGATTQSLVMRARSGTTRTITSEHQLWKLRAYSAFNFDGPGQRMS